MFTGYAALAYSTDNFTAASFVSHASNVKKEKLKDIDLLPRIRHKIMIVRDLASFFSAKDEELRKALGFLTRVLDGEGLQNDSGVHGQRGYKGDYVFMLLAASTPIQERAFRLMGCMGARLLLVSIDGREKSDDELAAQNRSRAHKEKEEKAKETTNDLLATLWNANPNGIDWDRSGDPEACLRAIASCARLLAQLRGTVQVSEENFEVTADVVEAPDRLNTLLYNLARGHAVLDGRRQINPDDLAPVLEVALSSAPRFRVRLIKGLVDAGGSLTTSLVEKTLGCSNPTALKEMDVFCALGIAKIVASDPSNGRPEKKITLVDKFAWFGSRECRDLRWKPPAITREDFSKQSGSLWAASSSTNNS
jgi:hypothetical protein